MRDQDAAIAVTRFGLGARPGEIAAAANDPKGWLKAQIRTEGAERFETSGETSAMRMAEYREFLRERATADSKDPEMARRLAAQSPIRENAGGDALARVRLGVQTPAGFRERWALFWANHFTVSATKAQVAGLVGPFETEAIRPHVFGRFADLLVAAETHPAMLLYLDQTQSVGPNSRAAMQPRRREGALPGGPRRPTGLNENLAREILELHTLGVDGGYTQADVTEFARALTGLSLSGPRDPVADQVVFRELAHEPGARRVLGRAYPSGGKMQGGAILGDLARHPSTARFVCTKIARHFTADTPPPALVSRLEAVWRATDGDLSRVAHALIEAPESWTPALAKLKTPMEFVISSWRALDVAPRGPGQFNQTLNGLGQRPFGAPSPEGWPDEAEPWAAADAMVKRLRFAENLAAQSAPRHSDPTALARSALGARLSPPTATAVARAESRPEAIALLLMSPEFQRR
jgi:uncharacterized protein (DUF1800 family)